MSNDRPALSQLVAKLSRRSVLDAADRAAILALPHVRRTFAAHDYIVREGETPRRHAALLLSGFAFGQKLTSQGARQIVALHMTGDLLDLESLMLQRADHNVQALTRLEIAEIERQALHALIAERPAIARAFWREGLVDASISREWMLNVGRRDSRARIAHVLCEFALRVEAAGLGARGGYELPLTQEQLGDATGLTSVHVNRTLRSLAADGLIDRDRRNLRFDDWERLRAVGDFSALYLHLPAADDDAD